MKLNKYIFGLTLFFILSVFTGSCFCEEDYFIDDEPVLMYKIIDWWEDCSSNRKHIFNMKPGNSEKQQVFEQRREKALLQYKDCDKFIGKSLEYNIIAKVEFDYQKDKKELNMVFGEDIAALLTGNRDLDNKPDLLVFKCIRINEKTFSASDIFNCGYAKINKNTLVFMDIPHDDAAKILKRGPEIGAVIKGVIGGLENNRIIFRNSSKNPEISPAMLTIYEPDKNFKTRNIFMEYILEPEISE